METTSRTLIQREFDDAIREFENKPDMDSIERKRILIMLRASANSANGGGTSIQKLSDTVCTLVLYQLDKEQRRNATCSAFCGKFLTEHGVTPIKKSNNEFAFKSVLGSFSAKGDVAKFCGKAITVILGCAIIYGVCAHNSKKRLQEFSILRDELNIVVSQLEKQEIIK